jgi:N-acyl-D-aspartate/D-glutamate deacylase
LNWIESALVDWGSATVVEVGTDANRDLVGRTVGHIAAERGSTPADTFFDIAVVDELRTYFELPPIGADERAWAARGAVWQDPRTVVGGSDAGAHLDIMCGASSATAFLGVGVRERGLLTLESAVHELTDVPARLWGLQHRGRIVVGYFADLVVFDPTRIGPASCTVRHDLPGGFPRLYAEAFGVERVFANGVQIVENGAVTGALPGSVLRSGRDTTTVTAASVAPALARAARDPRVGELYRDLSNRPKETG